MEFEHKITNKGEKIGGIREVFRYKDLIMLFVKRDFVANYKQTILGPLWAIIQPVLTTTVYFLIFGLIANLSSDSVPSYLFYFSGTIVWMLFSTTLHSSANSVIVNAHILTKVYFPRLVPAISSAISKTINFLIQFVLFIILCGIFKIKGCEFTCNLFVLLTPVMILQTILLAMGVGIIISAITVKYRDLAMLVTFGLELWKYLTPIAYDMEKLPYIAVGEQFYGLYMLNPVTNIVNMFRYAYFGVGSIDWLYYGISWLITILVFILGVMIFKKTEKTFSDLV